MKAKVRESRNAILAALIERDGLICVYPNEEHPVSLEDTGPDEVTIDHRHPQAWCLKNGWTDEQIWDMSNLQILCRRHNARKGDRLYRDDGTLEPRTRDLKIKIPRPEHCDVCESGRLLLDGEVCEYCGSHPQPLSFPKYAQRRPKECDHSIYHCFMCVVGFVPRVPASATAFGDEV